MNKASYIKFKKWLDEQPIGTEWDSRFVMELLKNDGLAELNGINAVKPLMAQFDNVEVTPAEKNVRAKYTKVKE